VAVTTDSLASPSENPGDAEPPKTLNRIRERLRTHGLTWGPKAWWIEIITILFGYGVYEIVQGAAPAHRTSAFDHAHQLIRFETWLHIDVEPPVNHFVNRYDWLASLTGYYYDSLHYLITPSVLLFIWFRRHDAYGRWRSALITASMSSLIVFWLWALAPPRMAQHGIIDTLVTRHIYGTVESDSSKTLVNNFAAMPSLHVGWALWCAAALISTTTWRYRYLFWLYPVATTLVVLGTGNHYLLDAAGGLLVLGIGIALTSPAASPADKLVSKPGWRRKRKAAQPATTSAPTGISAK
jgi:hypothetical protein